MTGRRSGPAGLRPDRTIEDVAFMQGLAPTRFQAVLFPVWAVEVEADVTKGEPYALIDRFVELAIAEARITTVADVASFLFLDEVVVGRAVRFLTAIGHLMATGDQLAVTELGYRSLGANQRYEISARDRRKLYFADYSSAPLPRPYYDANTVTLLDDAAANVLLAESWPRYFRLAGSLNFDIEAVGRLADHPERDHFNLPRGVNELRMIGSARIVWLPLHVVRAVDQRRQIHHLAYSQVGSTVNEELDAMIAGSPLPVILDAALEDGRAEQDENRVRAWLERRGLDDVVPQPTGDGSWTAIVPEEAFGEDRPLGLSRLGAWEVIDGCLLRLWCGSEELRRRALVDRMGALLAYQNSPVVADVERRLDPIARQLGLAPVTVADLQAMAAEQEARLVAARLARLG